MDLNDDVLALTMPSDALVGIREWLRAERVKAKWTQAELARRSGVPSATISRFEQTGLGSSDSFCKLLFALNQLEAFNDFLKARERLAELPASLNDPPRKRDVKRVRMAKGRT